MGCQAVSALLSGLGCTPLSPQSASMIVNAKEAYSNQTQPAHECECPVDTHGIYHVLQERDRNGRQCTAYYIYWKPEQLLAFDNSYRLGGYCRSWDYSLCV